MSRPAISITRATSSRELAAVLRLQRAILPHDVPASVETGWWWLARDADGNEVGFAGMYQSSRWIDAGYLCRAGVSARARGLGLQGRLISVRERQAKAVGLRWVITDTLHNPASANSLIRRNFRMYEPSNPWASTGACYWRKRISA